VVVQAAGLPFEVRTSGGATLGRGREVAAPALGEGNRTIFGDMLGLARSDIALLERDGVI